MLLFENDYLEGAHPKILESLQQTNFEQHPGYGTDDYCKSAADKIRLACGCPDAVVRFLVGGTQTNSTAIGALLRNYEGVIAADTGHILVHEAGAIEHNGHKVLSLTARDGKIDAARLQSYLTAFYKDDTFEHMVIPGMVYISHPTEYGTLYTKNELTQISEICRHYGLPLYLDGARLGYGLMSDGADVTLKDIAALCDAFYIGGTKVGALFGEALVFSGKNVPAHLTTTIKQNGALLAKGRLLGLQFDTLFTDNLYYEISRHALKLATRLRNSLLARGYTLYINSPTNQIFVLLNNIRMRQLAESVRFSVWEKPDDAHTVVRFATSWATTEDSISALEKLL